MAIKIYNTRTGKKEEFKPIKKDRVGIYVCGVTVYDECHIGHLRGAWTFDIVRRYFEYKRYKVKYVRNITDIDDKIIEKAQKEAGDIGNLSGDELKQKVKEVADRYTKNYYKDMELFGIKNADIEPKATKHIEDMISLIDKLVQKGYGYEKDGDVYFDVRKFSGYGKLSNQSLEKISPGARVDVGEKKKCPLDFALWKQAKEKEPYWESPWGDGRPGWHIECSTMSMKYLGENFDIHGGGIDLVFPHHENEIAQSECATGKPFANYWMHNGLLTINGEKMAKSLGNFISVKDTLKKSHPEVLKLFFLSSHYRSPIDWSSEKMEEMKKARERFYILFDKIDTLKSEKRKAKSEKRKKLDTFRRNFESTMDDDFNTANALSVLFDMVTYINKKIEDRKNGVLEDIFYVEKLLVELGNVLGLFEDIDKENMAIENEGLFRKVIDVLIVLRDESRRKKDFKTADRIRDELAKIGIVLGDEKDKTIWRIKD